MESGTWIACCRVQRSESRNSDLAKKKKFVRHNATSVVCHDHNQSTKTISTNVFDLFCNPSLQATMTKCLVGSRMIYGPKIRQGYLEAANNQEIPLSKRLLHPHTQTNTVSSRCTDLRAPKQRRITNQTSEARLDDLSNPPYERLPCPGVGWNGSKLVPTS